MPRPLNASGHVGRFETTQKLSWKRLSVSGKMGLRDPCPHAPLCSASLCLKPSRFLSGEAGQGSVQSPSSGRVEGGFWPSSLWLFYAPHPIHHPCSWFVWEPNPYSALGQLLAQYSGIHGSRGGARGSGLSSLWCPCH